MKKATVCVLMSTYNGEKYIKEQIDSILSQTEVEITLIVRDDRSTDRTLEILKSYESNGKIKVFFSSCNFGPAKSFMELLYTIDNYDYYAFADQDDIWKKEKIGRAVKMLDSENCPMLYTSNQILYRKGKEEGLRFKKIPNITLTGIICGNQVSGCTMVFNDELKRILVDKRYRPSDKLLNLRMHDTWIIAVANIVGKIVYDEESFIDYRIHENNVVGVNSGNIKNRTVKFFEKLFDKSRKNGRSKLACELCKIVDNVECEPAKIKVVKSFANPKIIKLLPDLEIRRDCPENRLLFILKLFCGWI